MNSFGPQDTSVLKTKFIGLFKLGCQKVNNKIWCNKNYA